MSQIALHISPSAIRMMEGKMEKARLVTGGHTILSNASVYFENGKLTRLREMARDIAKALEEEDITCKNLSICYDNDLTVEFLDTPIFDAEKEKKSIFKRDIGKKKEKVSDIPDGVLVKTHNWGETVNFRNDQEIRTVLSTVTNIDRDLSHAICYEFAELGYTVTSIESPQSALMYMRHANPYSYDSLAMLVLYVNNPNDMSWVYTFMKGVPRTAMKKYLGGQNGWSLSDRIVTTCQKEVAGNQLRRPTVILAGDAFSDMRAYQEVADALEREGFGVYDIYDHINERPNGESAVSMDDALVLDIEDTGMYHSETGDNMPICGMYSICMALLLRMLDKDPDNLVDPKDKPSTKRAALAATKSLMIAGIIALSLSVLALGYETVSWQLASKDLKNKTELESSLHSVSASAQNYSDKARSFSIGDKRFIAIIKFIQDNIKKGEINVASVDTDDMFDELVAADSALVEGENSDVTSNVAKVTLDSIAEQEAIIIRGYAETSQDVKSFYAKLCQLDGIGDVRLLGIQCVAWTPTTEKVTTVEKDATPTTATNNTGSSTTSYQVPTENETGNKNTSTISVTQKVMETVVEKVAGEEVQVYAFEIAVF